MPRKLAERLSHVAPNATLAVAARAGRIREAGRRVFDFSLGEPDFDTPVHIREAAKAALDAGETHHTPVGGTRELRSAICAATERNRGYRPAPNEVVVSCGAKHALFNVAMALFEPGDEVIIPAPYWETFPAQVMMAGATPVFLPTSEADHFRVGAIALAQAFTSRTKAILLSLPSIPTGVTYSEDLLLPLIEVLLQKDIWVVVDELYADLTYGSAKHVSVPAIADELRDRIIVVDGVGPTFGMGGWRIGWAIAPAGVCTALESVQSQTTTHASSIAQAAAVAALNGPRDEAHAMRAAFARRRSLLVEGLNATAGIACRMPAAALFALADVRGLYGSEWRGRRLLTDTAIAEWLIEVAQVAAVPGACFGAPGYLRFSFACSEEDIEAGLGALRGAIAGLS